MHLMKSFPKKLGKKGIFSILIWIIYQSVESFGEH